MIWTIKEGFNTSEGFWLCCDKSHKGIQPDNNPNHSMFWYCKWTDFPPSSRYFLRNLLSIPSVTLILKCQVSCISCNCIHWWVHNNHCSTCTWQSLTFPHSRTSQYFQVEVICQYDSNMYFSSLSHLLDWELEQDSCTSFRLSHLTYLHAPFLYVWLFLLSVVFWGNSCIVAYGSKGKCFYNDFALPTICTFNCIACKITRFYWSAGGKGLPQVEKDQPCKMDICFHSC